MRAIPVSMDPTIVAAVDARLTGVERDHDVTIPWAIESGSRAWGFPSPDSDYDCRFFYIRSQDSYLSPWRKRDVIETPLDKIFDVNGWDLSKALQLLTKGNATVVEWLRSPIIYRGEQQFRDELLDLAASIYDPSRAGRHYLHVGLQQVEKSRDKMTLKRVFYSLRPAATLLWLRQNADGGVPPMDLPTLMNESDMASDLRAAIDELVELKSVTREVGTGAVPQVVIDFIASELDAATELYESLDTAASASAVEQAEAFFLHALETFGADKQ